MSAIYHVGEFLNCLISGTSNAGCPAWRRNGWCRSSAAVARWDGSRTNILSKNPCIRGETWKRNERKLVNSTFEVRLFHRTPCTEGIRISESLFPDFSGCWTLTSLLSRWSRWSLWPEYQINLSSIQFFTGQNRFQMTWLSDHLNTRQRMWPKCKLIRRSDPPMYLHPLFQSSTSKCYCAL